MTGLAPPEATLLAQITVLLENCSRDQHHLARLRIAYQQAASALRTGRKAQAVLALLNEDIAADLARAPVSQPDVRED